LASYRYVMMRLDPDQPMRRVTTIPGYRLVDVNDDLFAFEPERGAMVYRRTSVHRSAPLDKKTERLRKELVSMQLMVEDAVAHNRPRDAADFKDEVARLEKLLKASEQKRESVPETEHVLRERLFLQPGYNTMPDGTVYVLERVHSVPVAYRVSTSTTNKEAERQSN